MNSIFLIIIILGISSQNILQKEFNKKTFGKGVYLFTLLSSLSAMLFFSLTSGKLDFNAAIIPYSLLFAVSYAFCIIFNFLAVANGSLSLSALLISYSLIIPTSYGLIFLDEPIGKGLIPGLLFLAVSLFLINKRNESVEITFKWLLYVFLAFMGNGMCTVIQKIQVLKFDGEYKNEFMIVALLVVGIMIGITMLITERKDVCTYIKKGWYLGILCGVANGIANLFVLILTGRMSVSVMFPLMSAGGLIVTFFVSKFLYKEKFSKKQIAGFVLGVLSVVFLNL